MHISRIDLKAQTAMYYTCITTISTVGNPDGLYILRSVFGFTLGVGQKCNFPLVRDVLKPESNPRPLTKGSTLHCVDFDFGSSSSYSRKCGIVMRYNSETRQLQTTFKAIAFAVQTKVVEVNQMLERANSRFELLPEKLKEKEEDEGDKSGKDTGVKAGKGKDKQVSAPLAVRVPGIVILEKNRWKTSLNDEGKVDITHRKSGEKRTITLADCLALPTISN